MKITLEKNGIRRTVKTGFSFLTLIFGFFVAMSRGMYKEAAISWFTFGFANWYYAFTINSAYQEKLQLEGWTVVGRAK